MDLQMKADHLPAYTNKQCLVGSANRIKHCDFGKPYLSLLRKLTRNYWVSCLRLHALKSLKKPIFHDFGIVAVDFLNVIQIMWY